VACLPRALWLVNGKSTRRRRGRSVTAASLLQQRVEDRGLEETGLSTPTVDTLKGVAAARTYHAETSYLAVTDGVFIRADRPHCVNDFKSMDPQNRPDPFKRYLGAGIVALPRDFPDTGRPALDVLAGRPADAQAPLDLGALARLLFFTAGVTRVTTMQGRKSYFRVAPAGGNLHSVEVYAVIGGVSGLAAGVYHFEPKEFQLEILRTGDWRGEVAAAAADQAASTAYLILSSLPFRIGWKYGERGYRQVYWDAGTVLSGCLAEVEAAGWRATVLAGFDDRRLMHLLGLDGVQEFPVAVIRLEAGETSKPAAAVASPAALEFSTSPLAPDVLEFPLVTATQRAGDLDGREAVLEWRRAAAGYGRPAGALRVTATASGPDHTIETLILQRGSTRIFKMGEAPHRFLAWAMAAAGRPVDSDFTSRGQTLLEHDLAVHQVAGIEPGFYRWRSGALERVASMDMVAVRKHSYLYCCSQPLGGDSAYTVYHCTDLDAVLNALGPRGYRAAHLEAGIAAGRLNLAAFALGLGASALTFVDVKVRGRFGGDCILVTAMGIPDYVNAKGGRPGQETELKLFEPLRNRMMARFKDNEHEPAKPASKDA
jgi:SagB-type dehydrogenase family enzyme